MFSDFPVSASVFVDGAFRGNTDKKGFLKVDSLQIDKTYLVKVMKTGFEEWQNRVRVLEGKTKNVSARLVAKADAFGRLDFRAVPFADTIFVDGEKLPRGTPYTAELPVGVHKVRYVNSKLGLEWETTIFLDLNEQREVTHVFKETGFGVINVVLKNAHEYGYGYVFINGSIWQKEGYSTTPLKIKLPVGSHKIEVKREGFHSSPVDTMVNIEKDARNLMKESLKYGFNVDFISKGREYDLELVSPKGKRFILAISSHIAKSKKRSKEKIGI
jgi:hypothetical protein